MLFFLIHGTYISPQINGVVYSKIKWFIVVLNVYTLSILALSRDLSQHDFAHDSSSLLSVTL